MEFPKWTKVVEGVVIHLIPLPPLEWKRLNKENFDENTQTQFGTFLLDFHKAVDFHQHGYLGVQNIFIKDNKFKLIYYGEMTKIEVDQLVLPGSDYDSVFGRTYKKFRKIYKEKAV